MSADSPRVYLLDVEGTTSPVSLVSEQLFPYARKHLAAYLRAHWDEAETRADLTLLAEENRAERDEQWVLRFAQDDKSSAQDDKSSARDDKSLGLDDTSRGQDDKEFNVGKSFDVDSAVEYLLWLMDRDRKSTALKSLQGRIWKAGYEAGELVGTMFPDVAAAFARWSETAKVAIYSSGSVEAQKLIFRCSSAGDLTPFITSYFDTRIGAKTSVESYRAIAAAMGVATSEILFVSDLLRELDPGREAGCVTRLSVREGNQLVGSDHGHIPIHSFADIY